MFADDLGGGGAPDPNPSLDDPAPDPDPSPNPDPNPGPDPDKSIWKGLDVKWPEGYQEEMKEENSLVPFVNKETGEINFSGLMKSYVHTKKHVGDKLAVPNEHASEEDRNEFFRKATGWEPDKDKYVLTPGEDSKVGPEFVTAFKETAHKLRIPAAAAAEMLKMVDSSSQSSLAQMGEKSVEAKNEGWDALKTEWGNAYPAKVQAAKQLVQEHGSEEFKTYLKENGLADDPRIFGFFSKIAGEVYAEADINTAGGRTPDGMTPDDAQKRINEVMADKNHPYHSKKIPGHADAVKDMRKLYLAKNGKKSA